MNNYPGIQYFKLKKEMPGAPVGTIVSHDGNVGCLVIHGYLGNGHKTDGINMGIEMAGMHPDWFEPITIEQHKKICQENSIIYVMNEFKCDRDEAIIKLESIDWNPVMEQEPGSADRIKTL